MISSIVSKFESYLNHYAMVKTRQLLLALDDQILEQAGISRNLLQRGVAYWPWQNDIDRNRQIIANSTGQKNKANSPLLSVEADTGQTSLTNAPSDAGISYPAGEHMVDAVAEKAA